MRVDIWSDVVCPWCYVGQARFASALAGFEHRTVAPPVERDRVTKLGERLKSDSELAPILARPEFQGLLGSLVNLGPDRVQ